MNAPLNIFLFFALYLLLIWKAGKSFPILYLFIFVYYVQYIFSTYLIYNVYSSLKGYMEIKQDMYFDYAVPALICASLGVVVFARNYDVRGLIKKINPDDAIIYGYVLVIVSLLFEVVSVPGLSSFTRYMKYSGAFCFLFSNARFKYLIVSFIYSLLLVEALTIGIFIDFFVFSTYLFFFVSLKFDFSFNLRVSFLIIAAPVLILVQSVKKEYREATWSGKEEAGTELFRELASENIRGETSKSYWESKGVIRTVGRLTQGWHLGLVLRWVPKQQPFSNGEEITGDIVGSLVPRLFYSDKKTTGSQEKFYRFTGHPLTAGTSMTIGVLGDFYINFGRTGSFYALFIFGAVVAIFLNFFIKKYVASNPINIIWIPFFFNYLMRANNDFYMVFNAMVKGFIIFLIVNYFIKRYLAKKKNQTFSQKRVSI